MEITSFVWLGTLHCMCISPWLHGHRDSNVSLLRPLLEIFFSKPHDFSILGHLRRNCIGCPHVRSLGPEESQSRLIQCTRGADYSHYPRLIFWTCQEYACVMLPGPEQEGCCSSEPPVHADKQLCSSSS